MELDGETEVEIADRPPSDASLDLALDHVLRTDEGFVAVRTTDSRELMRASLAASTQRIRVWVSDSSEPDKVVLELAT
jgi:hypothetical protein